MICGLLAVRARHERAATRGWRREAGRHVRHAGSLSLSDRSPCSGGIGQSTGRRLISQVQERVISRPGPVIVHQVCNAVRPSV